MNLLRNSNGPRAHRRRLLVLPLLLASGLAAAADCVNGLNPNGSCTVPAGITRITVYAIGAGGGGGWVPGGQGASGAGGGGGSVCSTTWSVVPGANVLVIPAGSAAGQTATTPAAGGLPSGVFSGINSLSAVGGSGAAGSTPGQSFAPACSGLSNQGGIGGSGLGSEAGGGGGGGAAGAGGLGGNGTPAGTVTTGGAGGPGIPSGGQGGDGGRSRSASHSNIPGLASGLDGAFPGGGGGGTGSALASDHGGRGAAGAVYLYWPPVSCGGVTQVSTDLELFSALASFNSITTNNCVATISFANDISLVSLGNHFEGLKPVSNPLPTIWNPHPGTRLIIEGNGHKLDNAGGTFRRLLYVYNDTTVTVNDLTITNGDMSGGTQERRGGGILNRGTLTLNRATVSGNRVGSKGAGIANQGGTLVIDRSTLWGNIKSALPGADSTIIGGGIYSEGAFANVTITNSTLSGNTAEAIWQNGGKLSLDSVTVTENGAGLVAFGAAPLQVSLTNSILSENGAGLPESDCYFQNADGNDRVLADGGHNLVGYGQATCGIVDGVNGNITQQAPMLGPLGNNGGPTRTHAPLVGSPVLDAGATTLVTDQRGQTRPIGPAADIGAFESSKCLGLTTFPVTSEKEWQDAIACFNTRSNPGVYTIRLNGGWAQGASSPVIANTTAGVSLVIEGQGKFIEGFYNGQDPTRLVEVAQGTDVTIDNLKLQTGNVPGGDGGAILNRGKLKLVGVTIEQSIAARGGALFNDTTGDATIESSTFDRNGSNSGPVLSQGAAVHNAGHMVIRNSTFSGNSSLFFSAIENVTAASIAIDSVTITQNHSVNASVAVGLAGTAGNVTLNNSIIAGNTAGAGNAPADLVATCAALSGSHNLVFADQSGCFTDGVNGNIVGHAPNLGPLRSNGGVTLTHDLLPTSPAVDAGATALTVDQRGQARPVGVGKDVGAVETTESQNGLLTIVKRTGDPNDSGLYDFTLAGGTLGSPIQFQLQNTNSRQFVLAAGQYAVTEDFPGPAGAVEITCVDANLGISGTTDGSVLTVDLAAKQNMICTVYNKAWYTVHATASAFGTVSCAPEMVVKGGSSTCTAVPQSGFMVQNWTDDCVAAGQDTQCYLSKITGDVDTTVAFTGIPLGTFTVSAKVKSGKGSVTCDPALVTSGGISTCTATPNPGYEFTGWEGDCASFGNDEQCYMSKIKSDRSSLANFSAIPPPQPIAVTAKAADGNGTVGCTPASVSPGGSAACTAKPKAGFRVAGWLGACAGAGSSNDCGLTNIQTDQDSTVYFEAIDYTVTASVVGGNGAVSCAPPTVNFGGSSLCTAVPNAGFRVTGWTGACAATGTNVQCSLDDIESNQTSTVSFGLIPPSVYTVTAKVTGSGGAVDCSPTSVNAGGSAACTAKPKPGYRVAGWTGACAAAGTNSVCNLANIQTNQSSTLTFALINYAVTASVAGANGTVSCAPASVTSGGASTCTAVPSNGYQVSTWTGPCAAAGTDVQCALVDIQADQVSTVSFVSIPPSTFSVSAKVSGSGGTVSCTPDNVPAGEDAICTAKPKPGYAVAGWTGPCASAGTSTVCSFTGVQSNQSATVTFVLVNYAVTATIAAGSGSVGCTPPTVTIGGSSVCTATPDAGWQVSGWTGACASAGTAAVCNIDDIQSDLVSSVSFAAIVVPPQPATAVPTLSEWALCVLGLLLAAAGARRRRR